VVGATSSDDLLVTFAAGLDAITTPDSFLLSVQAKRLLGPRNKLLVFTGLAYGLGDCFR